MKAWLCSLNSGGIQEKTLSPITMRERWVKEDKNAFVLMFKLYMYQKSCGCVRFECLTPLKISVTSSAVQHSLKKSVKKNICKINCNGECLKNNEKYQSASLDTQHLTFCEQFKLEYLNVSAV